MTSGFQAPAGAWDHKDHQKRVPFLTLLSVLRKTYVQSVTSSTGAKQCVSGREPFRDQYLGAVQSGRKKDLHRWNGAPGNICQLCRWMYSMLCIHYFILTLTTLWGTCWDPSVQTGELIWNHAQGGVAVKCCQDLDPDLWLQSLCSCQDILRERKHGPRSGRAGVAWWCHVVRCSESSFGGRRPRGGLWTLRPEQRHEQEAGPWSQIPF